MKQHECSRKRRPLSSPRSAPYVAVTLDRAFRPGRGVANCLSRCLYGAGIGGHPTAKLLRACWALLLLLLRFPTAVSTKGTKRLFSHSADEAVCPVAGRIFFFFRLSLRPS